MDLITIGLVPDHQYHADGTIQSRRYFWHDDFSAEATALDWATGEPDRNGTASVYLSKGDNFKVACCSKYEIYFTNHF